MTAGGEDSGLSFWEHLDVMRGAILRSLAITTLCAIVAFLFKDRLFECVLAPGHADFLTYRALESACSRFGIVYDSDFSVNLINTGLASQFIIHLKTAMCVGLLCASPYILYEIFRFVSPALYERERRVALRMVSSGYLMFLLGTALSYFIIFPVTFRFLGTYQVSGEVANMISLESYMSTLIMMCLSLGIVCEMPVLAWLFAKSGLLTAQFLRTYRRHAIVLILTVAAIITPTSDAFTLLLVAAPMILLYEVSILVVRSTAAAPRAAAR